MLEDKEIIKLFFDRSEQAVQELDIKYGKVLQNLSYNIVNNMQDAEECVNDDYLGTWNTVPPVNPDPLLAYVCKITKNISLKVYYKNKAVKRGSNYTVAMEEIEACIKTQETVKSSVCTRELASVIESFLDTLDKKNRVIFMRRYWFCDNYKDIARLTGLTSKNISVRLARIRHKLKKYLAEMELI